MTDDNTIPDWAQDKSPPTDSTPSQSAAPAPDWAQDEKPMNWSDVPGAALKNLPSSAVKFGHDIVQPFLHPVDTAKSIYNIGSGALQKTGVISGEENVPYADAFGKAVADRYGGMDALKKTMAEDPVGAAGDLSMVLSGGAMGAARIPAVGGRLAEAANTAARITNPLTLPAKAVTGATNLGTHVVSTLSGMDPEAYRIAYGAGKDSWLSSPEAREGAAAFQEDLRGHGGASETVAAARQGVDNLRRERATAYRAGMAGVDDGVVLDFNKIDNAFSKVADVKNYKGKSGISEGQDISPSTANIRAQLKDAIDGWRDLDPREFHTAEGFDALKQKIGDIRDATQPGTPERVVANSVYNGVRQTIIDQSPQYAKVMKGYETASQTLKEIEKTLSLNPNATIDTSLRKLQSVLRNNVNTNYGRRAELAEFLVNAGAPHLMQRLAGQSLSSWTPRGLGRLSISLGAEIVAMAAGHATHGLHGAAYAASLLPFMSPRLTGEGAYYAGKAAAPFSKIPIQGAALPAAALGRNTETNQPSTPGWAKSRGGRTSSIQQTIQLLRRSQSHN